MVCGLFWCSRCRQITAPLMGAIIYPYYTLRVSLISTYNLLTARQERFLIIIKQAIKEQFFAKKVEEYRIILYVLAYIKLL